MKILCEDKTLLFYVAPLIRDCECEEDVDGWRDQLLKLLSANRTYLSSNQRFIPNYVDLYRYGEKISSSFAESAIIEVVDRYMVKDSK